MNDHARLIDTGDPTTWPPTVAAILSEVGSLIPKRPKPFATDIEYGSDTGLSLEDKLRRLLHGKPLAMYHATRLLESEVAIIRNEGLLLQTPALRAAKLDGLLAEGLATRQEVTLWEANGPVFWPGHEARQNEVCVVAPVQIFTEFRDGFISLFGDWGGESLSWAASEPGREGADPTRDQIRTVLNRINESSRPAVIEVALEPDDLPEFPRLWQVMVGRLIGARGASNEWHLRTPVSRILDVIQAGNPRWKSSWLRKTG